MGGHRGVSEVTGTILLLGMVLLMTTVTVAVGGPLFERAQSRVTTEQAELAAGEFSRSVLAVTDGGSPARRVDTGRVRTTVHPNRGWMRVSTPDETLVNETLGAVRFGEGSSHVVYQGGTIFRVDGESATARRSAYVSYRDDTLTLSVLGVRGGPATARSVVTRPRGSAAVFPRPEQNLTNPIRNESLTLTVRSRYYRAWGRYFEARFDASPSYAPANHTVTVTFLPVGGDGAVTAGILAGTPTSTLRLSGGMTTDSYDSSLGPYAGGRGAGRVVSAGSVELTGGATLEGGLVAAKDVTVDGGGTLDGPLAVGEDLTLTGGGDVDATGTDGARVAGDVTVDWGTTFDGPLTYGGTLTDPGGEVPNASAGSVSVSVPSPPSIASYHARVVNETRTFNDNASTPAVTNGSLDCSRDVDGDPNDDECELTAGSYYLDDLTLDSNEELVLNTTDGGIRLVVDGDATLDGASTVRVVGDGRVNLFVTGQYAQRGSGEVVNAGDDAPQFWVYLPPGGSADLTGGGRFVGVLYGPGANVDVGPVPVYGAIVGDIDLVASGVEIHYDAALRDATPTPPPPGGVPIQYLHVRRATINVTAA